MDESALTYGSPRPTGTAVRCALGLVFVLGCAVDTPDNSLHPAFRLGETAEVLRPLINEDCAHIEELYYTGEMAAPFEKQTQINCSGLEVLGARRDVELMFNDGPLGHLWIHIEPGEDEVLIPTLEKLFGEVVYRTESDQVFASGTAALRREPPEILIGTPDIITALTGYDGGNR